jgi:putative serine protease PepD
VTSSGVPEPVGPPPALPPYGRPPWAAPDHGSSGTPAWLLALLVGLALLTGLVGGLLGGALVLGTSGSGGANLLPTLDEAPPLAHGGSVAAVAQRLLPSTVQVRVVSGDQSTTSGATGSGFAVDSRGHVITNNHVVEVAGKDGTITVVDAQGRVHRAEVVGRSPVYDIAVLDVRPRIGLRPAALGSSRRINVGDTVVAIGSPLGLRSTVTSGIVSALDRPVTTGGSSGDSSSFINAVQTDAAINPGNSGGPLVDLAGRVVGVNSAIATTGNTFGGQSGNIGVGFAIPMEQVRVTANQILDTGEAQYPVIGASVDTSASSRGAIVTKVRDGTPAARSGLRVGDRIVAVDRVHVADGVALIVAIRTHRPGQRIALTFVRNGSQQTLEVVLDAEVG